MTTNRQRDGVALKQGNLGESHVANLDVSSFTFALDAPANWGIACVKGQSEYALATITLPKLQKFLLGLA